MLHCMVSPDASCALAGSTRKGGYAVRVKSASMAPTLVTRHVWDAEHLAGVIGNCRRSGKSRAALLPATVQGTRNFSRSVQMTRS